jgi:hypothetical protein
MTNALYRVINNKQDNTKSNDKTKSNDMTQLNDKSKKTEKKTNSFIRLFFLPSLPETVEQFY